MPRSKAFSLQLLNYTQLQRARWKSPPAQIQPNLGNNQDRKTLANTTVKPHQHLTPSVDRRAHADAPPKAIEVAVSPRSTAVRLAPMSVGSKPTVTSEPMPSSPCPLSPQHYMEASGCGAFDSTRVGWRWVGKFQVLTPRACPRRH